MKANYELGDWVLDTEFGRNRPDTIECLEPHRVWLTNGKLYQPIDTIKPIPITTEILEKNRFLLHNSASYFKEYMWTTGGIDEYADVYIEVGKDQQDNWRWDNLNFKLHFLGGDMSLRKMHYVHELQHALKLCRIDKTIEPWK